MIQLSAHAAKSKVMVVEREGEYVGLDGRN